MNKVLAICTLVVFLAFVPSSSSTQLAKRRFPRSYSVTRQPDGSGIKLGDPGKNDILLLDTTVSKEKRKGRVVYEDVIFSQESYQNETVSDCPYNITAISAEYAGSDTTAAYPVILYGGIGGPEVLILFISQRDEGIDYTLKIWGREYGKANEDNNLVDGTPAIDDELLLYTNAIQTLRLDDQVHGTVVYQQPMFKKVTITSVQAWDISAGCKAGGFPAIIEGGVGSNNVTVEIRSQLYHGFEYHVLVFGKVERNYGIE